MTITTEDIKKLRELTNAGVMDCRKALEESNGNFEKAVEWLRAKGAAKAEKRAERVVSQGFIEAYLHGDGKIVSVVELLCETDFVALTADFRKLAHELAMQVAAMKPENNQELLKQPYIRNEKVTMGDLVNEMVGKTGEKIQVGRIVRMQIGE